MDRRSFLTIGAAVSATVAGSEAVQAADPTRRLDWLRYDHVSIHVADFDGTLRWYKEKLGFREEVSWRVAALNGKQLAYLSKNGSWIELVSATPVQSGLPPVNSFVEHFSRLGFGHLCFATGDIDGVMRDLKEMGISVFVEAQTYPLDGTVFERRVAFIKDPEGNVIEFGGPLVARGV
jgi:catechol 2,3-dioxygenase-like lactoylglutathione lyase family enzyme